MKKLKNLFIKVRLLIAINLLKSLFIGDIRAGSHARRSLLAKHLSDHISSLLWIVERNNLPSINNLSNIKLIEGVNSIRNFEDLAFLFNCNHSNRGIVALDFDEAAYIFKLIRHGNFSNILEIGRFLGGSTVLIGVAKSRSTNFKSIDLKVKFQEYASDDHIRSFLDKQAIENVELIIGDSRNFNPLTLLDFVFIDGDHSYEGVKADLLNVKQYLTPGAHVLFHDSVCSRVHATCDIEVNRFIDEILGDNDFSHVANVGSISHFQFKL